MERVAAAFAPRPAAIEIGGASILTTSAEVLTFAGCPRPGGSGAVNDRLVHPDRSSPRETARHTLLSITFMTEHVTAKCRQYHRHQHLVSAAGLATALPRSSGIDFSVCDFRHCDHRLKSMPPPGRYRL